MAAEEITASAALERCLGAYVRDNDALNAITVLLADEARVEASQRDLVVAARKPLGPLHGVPIAIKEEFAVAGTVTTFGGLGNSTPATADAEVVRRLRAAGAVIVGKTNMPEFGAIPFTESDALRADPQPVGPDAVAGRLQRRQRGRGRHRDGRRRDGWRRRWLDPHPRRVRGPLRAEAATRPGHHRAGAAPVVVARDRRAAHPVGPRQRDRVRRRARQHRDRPLSRRRGRVVRRRRPPRARPAADRLVDEDDVAGDPPHADDVRALEDTVRLLVDLGHDVREIDPHYPDASAAFVPQFFASIRSETDALEHPELVSSAQRGRQHDRASGRPRGSATWHPAGRAGRAPSANRVFEGDGGRRADDADDGEPPAGGRARDRPGRRPLVAARRCRRSRTSRIWNVAGNPAASVPAGFAPDGLPTAVQLVGPHRRRAGPAVAVGPARGGAALAVPEMTALSGEFGPSAPVGWLLVGAIEVVDLAKSYGETRAVDGVTFEVAEGEFFGILGPNGAGKTTTLEMIEGLRRPDAGEIRVLGEQPWPRNPALLPRMGVQLQASSFFERLTAREQLAHVRRAVRRRAGQGRRVDRAGRAGRQGRRPGSRSSPAARPSGSPSPARWCTTPTSSSSTSRRPRSTRRPAATCGTCSRGLNDCGRTVVLTTHYMDEAEALCDRVAIMDHGRILAARLARGAGPRARRGHPDHGRCRVDAARGGRAARRRRAVEQTPDGLVLATRAPAAVLTELAGRGALDGVRVQAGTLEDVFLATTGREYRA